MKKDEGTVEHLVCLDVGHLWHLVSCSHSQEQMSNWLFCHRCGEFDEVGGHPEDLGRVWDVFLAQKKGPEDMNDDFDDSEWLDFTDLEDDEETAAELAADKLLDLPN